MSSISSIRFFVVLCFFLQFASAATQCYSLNGTQLSDEYGPCDSHAKHSGCCALYRPAGSVELCLSNGLCMATNNEYMGTIWQPGCTDPTGMDASCPKMCPDARDNIDSGTNVSAWNIQTCDYGSYCCRAANDRNNCCNDATAPKIKTKFLGAFQFNTSTTDTSSTTTSVTSSTITSTTSPSSTTQALATADPSNIASTEPDLCKTEQRRTAVVSGTIAGIFSAVIVGLLAVIALLYLKEKKQRKLKEHYEEQFATSNWGGYGSRIGSKSTVIEPNAGKAPTEKDVEVRYIGRRDT